MLDILAERGRRRQLPAIGTPWPQLRDQLAQAKRGDCRWEKGRLPLYVYWLDEALAEVTQASAAMYFMENGLGRKAFPSVQRLQQEVLEMALSLFEAPPDAGGSFTSGGTESIFQAVKSARERKRARGVARSERCSIVLPRTAHPAFDKAAHYLDMDAIRVPTAADHRADPIAMAAAIEERTALLVGSAPCYPFGLFDPIDALSALALERGLPLHVDACVGGFLAPFMKRNGEPIPAFDFTLPGVTSLSADLHKYGFAAKGASLVLYRDAAMLDHQRFTFDDWPRGNYTTDTFLGTRPAGPVASAWAVMNYLGEAGYRRMAAIVAETRERMVRGISAIGGLEVLRPASELSFVLYGSTDPAVDIHAVAQQLEAKGWFVARSVAPPAIHFMVNPLHAAVMGSYLVDVAQAVADARQDGRAAVPDLNTY